MPSDPVSKPKTGSLADLGLRRWADEYLYKYGGYPKLDYLLDNGQSNAEIARLMSPADNPRHRQTVRPWRARWELEREHPELRDGGVL